MQIEQLLSMDLLKAVKRYYNNSISREAPLLTEYLHQITLCNSRLWTMQALLTFCRKLKCPRCIGDDSKVCTRLLTNTFSFCICFEINRAIKILLRTQHVKKLPVILSNHVFAPINSRIMYLNKNGHISRSNEIIDQNLKTTQLKHKT